MTKLTKQEIDYLRYSFEQMVRREFDSSYNKKDKNDNYESPFIDGQWRLNLSLAELAKSENND